MSHAIDNPPTVDDVTTNCRLVIAFPLSGDLGLGSKIYIDERTERGDDHSYWIVTNGTYVTPRHYGHLHEAIARCLANSGWGEYSITPPEGINW